MTVFGSIYTSQGRGVGLFAYSFRECKPNEINAQGCGVNTMKQQGRQGERRGGRKDTNEWNYTVRSKENDFLIQIKLVKMVEDVIEIIIKKKEIRPQSHPGAHNPYNDQ